MKKETINTSKDWLNDLKDTLERVIIILEDNPKIKDTSDFYNGLDLMFEVSEFHKDIEEVLK